MIAPTVASVQPPPPPYWEHLGDNYSASVEFIAGGKLYHVNDSAGENRRLFEAWLSLRGADYQDEDIPISILEEGVKAYAAKNDVILWDHKRDFPIARLLEWEVTKEGLFIRGEVLSATHFDDPDSEILKKANEVWSLVKRGHIRGISWDGRGRKRWVFSPELGKYIKQPIEILMSEITITPVQVNPGAKIVGVNTLSKALHICKALELGSDQQKGESQMNDAMSRVVKAQQALLENLRALPDGVELPPEVVKAQEAMTKALGLQEGGEPSAPEPPAWFKQFAENMHKSLETVQQNVQQQAQQIRQLGGKAAPLQNRVTHSNGDPSASGRPIEEEPHFYEQTTKALEVGGNIRNNRLNRGIGDLAFIPGEDLMLMYMVNTGQRLKAQPFKRGGPELSWHPKTVDFFNKINATQ